MVSKTGHMIIMGLPILRVRRRNPPDTSETHRATRVRDKVTQRVASNWHIWSPIEGSRCPQALYLSLEQGVSFMPLCGLASSRPGFLLGLPGNEA
jgi:hypothetical protein